MEEQQHQEQSWTDRTGGDIPSGYRPCPFCRAVIPWGSERCPSCGRVLIERRVPGGAQAGPGGQRASRLTWWARVAAPAWRRMRVSVENRWRGARRTSQAQWNTTSRGASWSVFRPAAAPTRTWWHGLVPAPTPQERRILVTATVVMVGLLLLALVLR